MHPLFYKKGEKWIIKNLIKEDITEKSRCADCALASSNFVTIR